MSALFLIAHAFKKYNVSWQNTVKTHCVTFSLSDPNPKKDVFRKPCEVEDSEECNWCSSLFSLADKIQGAIENLKTEENQTDLVAASHDVKQAFKAIVAYRNHILRQSATFVIFLSNLAPTVLFLFSFPLWHFENMYKKCQKHFWMLTLHCVLFGF